MIDSISNFVITELSDFIKTFNPIKDNFYNLAEKVYNSVVNHTIDNNINKCRITIDILIKIINNFTITKNHQIYLMESIHTIVFDLDEQYLQQQQQQQQKLESTENDHNHETTHINIEINDSKEEFYETQEQQQPPQVQSLPETNTEQEQEKKIPSIHEFNDITNELYEIIYNKIMNEKIEPENIPIQLIFIVSKMGNVISKYTDLSWENKKIIILDAFTKFKENIDKIFPGINEIDKNLIITALSSVPTLFDYFISITTGKYNNYMKKFMNNIFSFPQN